MFKMTKVQRKNRERIMAWLEGRIFQETSRDRRPVVPELSVERVLEEYVPPDVTGAGQFFTPLATAAAAFSQMQPVYPNGREYVRVLDPCAGIGHLLYHFRNVSHYLFDAYELEEECVRAGMRLFPQARWHHEIPFCHRDALAGKYDLVVMNPPFGTMRGMSEGERMCQGRCTRSEHIFTELAIRALRPGGQAVVFGPYNLFDRMPQTAWDWFNLHARLEHSQGPLPGQFSCTSVQVHAFYMRRLGVDEEMAVKRAAGAYSQPTLF